MDMSCTVITYLLTYAQLFGVMLQATVVLDSNAICSETFGGTHVHIDP